MKEYNERRRRYCYDELKNQIIKVFTLENILYELKKDYILFELNERRYIYINQDKEFDTNIFYSKDPEKIEIANNFSIRGYEMPKLIKKLPYREEEFYKFFKDIIKGMGCYFYENLSLQDIYYSIDDKEYIILAPCYGRVPEEINICISNLFQDKSVYTYKDTEIKTLSELNDFIWGDFYD